jgi:O-antigen/teichoic acid export membrane protein
MSIDDVAAPARVRPFRSFARAAGKLAIARQVSGLVFVGAVLVLPALVASRGTATSFVWAYFAMMTLTSLLGFGLERLSGSLVAERPGQPAGTVIAPILAARVVTLPAAALSLWAILTFVGVHLSAAAWWSTMLWVTAGLFAPIAFAALRSLGRSSVEPVVMTSMRVLQAGALVALAAGGAGTAPLVAAVAVLECGGAWLATRAVGRRPRWWTAFRELPELPMRRALGLAGIEVVTLVNQRVDLLLVGRILGAAPGAVYGMLYRAVDAFGGVVGSAGLWLYAEHAHGDDSEARALAVRRGSLRVMPGLAVLVGLVGVLLAGPIAGFVPLLEHDAATLRVLVVAFPLMTLNGIELSVRSGLGRNREVLRIGMSAFVVNVALCLGLIPVVGLVGGAVALAASEALQCLLLVVSASRQERQLVGPGVGAAVIGAGALVLVGVAVGEGQLGVALIGVALALAAAALPYRRLRDEMVAS